MAHALCQNLHYEVAAACAVEDLPPETAEDIAQYKDEEESEANDRGDDDV